MWKNVYFKNNKKYTILVLFSNIYAVERKTGWNQYSNT